VWVHQGLDPSLELEEVGECASGRVREWATARVGKCAKWVGPELTQQLWDVPVPLI